MSITTDSLPVAPRLAPALSVGWLGWVRANLFSSWLNSLVTIALAYFIVKYAIGFWIGPL